MKLYILFSGLIILTAVFIILTNPVSAVSWTNIPGQSPSSPAVVWNSDISKVHIVVRASDNSLWFATINENKSVYSGFKGIPGATPATPALTWNPDLKKIHIAVMGTDKIKGTDNNTLWFATLNQDGTFYSDWKKIPGGLASAPALTWDSNLKKIHIVVRASDDSLWFATLNSDGTFYKDWVVIPARSNSAPALAQVPATDKLYLFVKGTDNNLWLAGLRTSATSIFDNYWKSIPGGLIESPAVTLNGNKNNLAYIVVTAPDNSLYIADYDLTIPENYQQNLRVSDFVFNDYSVDNLASGGKRLNFLLSNADYKVKLSYTLESGQKFISKSLDIMNSSGQFGPVNHNAQSSGVYVNLNNPVFSIGNSFVERKFTVTNGIIRTTEIYNKLAGIKHPTNSDEFEIEIMNKTDVVFLDLERISFGKKAVWYRDRGDPLIYNDLFVWSTHPYHVPKLDYVGSEQHALERFNFYSTKIGNTFALGKYEALIGVTKNGKGVEGFKDFLLDLAKPEKKFFFTYNTWWTTNPYSENIINNLIDEFNAKLFSPYNVKFDSFTLDDGGWPNPQSIWGINPVNFPNGFASIKNKLNNLGVALGLWFSPSARYPSLSKDWAGQNNYYVTTIPGYLNENFLCFSEEPGKASYYQKIKDVFSGYVSAYNLSNLKFDGFVPCHNLAVDEVDNLIEFQESLRKINPNIRYEVNFGPFTPALILSGKEQLFVPSGDYPSGIVPSLNPKDAYTSTRDQYWIDHGKVFGKRIIPEQFLHELGIIIQTNDEWYNDAIINLLRGTSYVPLYINPKYIINNEGWAFLAGILKWGRANQETLLSNTYFIGGEPKNLEVYGFAHFNPNANEGYVVLRNPSMAGKDFTLKIDSSIGISGGGQYILKTVYPFKYVYDSFYSYGSSQNIHLSAFETLVIHIKPLSAIKNELTGVRYEYLLQNGKNVLKIWDKQNSKINAKILTSNGQLSQSIPLDFCSSASTLNISSSQLTKISNFITGSFDISRTSNFDTELVVLIDSANYFDVNNINSYSFSIDGQLVNPKKQTSSDQWLQIGVGENLLHYWLYLRVPVTSGNHKVSFNVNFPSGLSSSANILYKEKLVGKEIEQSSWIRDTDDYLKTSGIDMFSGSIVVGQNYKEVSECIPSTSLSTPISSFATPTPISTSSPTPTSAVLFARNLHLGSRNSDIQKLQKFLAESKEIYPEGLVTGYFGNLTKKAVQNFQCKYNIVCSGNPTATGYGQVGPKTRQKLNELFK